MSTADDLTKAARAAKQGAWREGYQAGQAWVVGQNTGYGDPYLAYMFFIGVSQAIANHGRSISGIQFGKANDPERKGKKA